MSGSDRVLPVQLWPHPNGISKSGPEAGLTVVVRAFAGPIRPKPWSALRDRSQCQRQHPARPSQ